MSKNPQVVYSNQPSMPNNIFVLDRSHQKLVTGKRDYRYLVEANVGYGILVGFILIILTTVARPSGDKSANTFFIEPIHLIGLSITIIIVWIIFQVRSYLRFQQRWQNGHFICGQIKSIHGEKVRWLGGSRGNSPNYSYDVTVHCQFVNPKGRIISTHATHMRKELMGKELPKKGFVAILYVNDKDFMVL